MKYHGKSLSKKWRRLELCEQLGNIGSEVGRSITSRNKEAATERALELFDLTLSDSRWAGARRKEIARARESYLEDLAINDKDALNKINKYFYYFALLARSRR